MRSAWQAAQIVWTLHRENSSGIKSARTIRIQIDTQERKACDKKNCEVDVYEPHVKCRGTIAVIHGMSPNGKDDPRIIVLCQALCQTGFRVLAPEIESIKALRVDADQVVNVANILNVLASDQELSPSGRIAVLAPSFSGAICLAAVAMPEVKDKIISVCAIGAFTQIDAVIRHLLTDEAADPYGRYIILKKVLPLVMSNDQSMQKALDAAIRDNLNESINIELQACLSELSSQDRAQVNRLLNDARYRCDLFESSKAVLNVELAELDIVHRLSQITARVFLLHGKHDKVIPCGQSQMLYSQLKKLKKPSDLVVTPFISHGDTRFSLTLIPDLVKIIRGFAFFFDDLQHAN